MVFIKKKTGDLIRYFFIAVVYNFIVSGLLYLVDYLNRKIFHWDVQEWTIPTVLFVVSIMLVIGGFLLAAAPVINEWLYTRIEVKIVKLQEKMKNESNKYRSVPISETVSD